MASDTPHDGSGLPPSEAAARLAAVLALSPEAAQQFVAELRNALVPARHWAERGDPRALDGIRRALLLVDAVATRSELSKEPTP